jgi:inorganic phosphate transporter, PiT family
VATLEIVGNTLLLCLVVVTALAFDFTNGFHDTGNAMATSIATGALKPRVAVALSGVLNLVGAFLSLSVAATIASGLVDTGLITLTVVFAGLCGGIIWNLLTWFLGIPSSSSHALIGGVVGSAIAAAGGHAVEWHGLVQKVIIPAGLSPLIAGLVATVGTYAIYRISRGMRDSTRTSGFRLGQIGSASMVSLAHGTNDAQKTMGIITLALIANGTLHRGASAPFWVILSCALAISIGTYTGGWRVIRTLGKGLVDIEAPQGMAAESSSAAVILLSSHFGYSLSTTHVATGSILGTGLGKRGAEVRWSVAGRMATAWLFTLPAAGLVGAGSYAVAAAIGGDAGIFVVLAVLVAVAGLIYARSRRTAVKHDNVNAEWTGSVAPPAERDAELTGAVA